MHLQTTFPLMYCLNLARRQDRRARCEGIFEDFGLPVRRFPAVDANYVRNARGFASAGRYAHAVSARLILREAMRRGAPAVFIFEDDVIFSPDLHGRLAAIELPEDWGIFYLGCQHQERPEVAAPGLVKVNGALDTHAWGVRAEFYPLVMAVLDAKIHPPRTRKPACDVYLACAHRLIPTYAAFPNLAWQQEEHSDLCGGISSNYNADGTQRPAEPVLRGILAEALGIKAWSRAGAASEGYFHDFHMRGYYGNKIPQPEIAGSEAAQATLRRLIRSAAPPAVEGSGAGGGKAGDSLQSGVAQAPEAPAQKIAFLYLPGMEPENAPIWDEYFGGHEGAYSRYGKEGDQGNADRRAEGGIALVRAQLRLLRSALADAGNGWFVLLPGTSLPVRPLGDLRRSLRWDGRSRFAWAAPPELDAAQEEEASRMRGIPATYARFHRPWLLLNRQAAELAAEDDLTDRFAGLSAPEECYFGTVLNVKGYRPEDEVACLGFVAEEYAGAANAGELAALLDASGKYFAIASAGYSELIAEAGMVLRRRFAKRGRQAP